MCAGRMLGPAPSGLRDSRARHCIPETVVIYGEAAAYWVPAFAGDDEAGEAAPYAFFFTSLTLEKVIPSARSRV